jgi:hypothetical protein
MINDIYDMFFYEKIGYPRLPPVPTDHHVLDSKTTHFLQQIPDVKNKTSSLCQLHLRKK